MAAFLVFLVESKFIFPSPSPSPKKFSRVTLRKVLSRDFLEGKWILKTQISRNENRAIEAKIVWHVWQIIDFMNYKQTLWIMLVSIPCDVHSFEHHIITRKIMYDPMHYPFDTLEL